MKEIAYLRSLPAVDNVGRDRIRYAQWFKNDCIVRYRGGDSPARIFREAGLDSSIIGYKRIERCVARWRREIPQKAQLSGHDLRSQPLQSGESNDQAQRIAIFRAVEQSHIDENESRRGHDSHDLSALYVAEASSRPSGGDLRDELIAQQIRRIHELEREIEMLRHQQTGDTGQKDAENSPNASA